MICTSYASDSIFLNLEVAITKNEREGTGGTSREKEREWQTYWTLGPLHKSCWRNVFLKIEEIHEEKSVCEH